MPPQPDLFSDDDTGPVTLRDRFNEWIETAKGQTVYKEAVGLALQLRSQGYVKHGIAAIYEYMRFKRTLANGPDDPGGYKLTNDFKPFLSRYIMNKVPELDGFFVIKQMTANGE